MHRNGAGQTRGSFLNLPPEIRLKIYRFLLCGDDLITPSWSFELHPSILGTCRQVLFEARPILYEENTWHLRIFVDSFGEGRADFRGTDHFGEDRDYRFRRRISNLRRFDIAVEIQDEGDLWTVRLAVRMVCEVLCDLPRLNYLHIRLDGRGTIDARPFYNVLENFGLLRRVRKVEFTGVPPAYAEYLERRITGSAPLDHLPKMYEALKDYADPFDFCVGLLRQAGDTVEYGDVKQFKNLRAHIVDEIANYMANGTSLLYEHDG